MSGCATSRFRCAQFLRLLAGSNSRGVGGSLAIASGYSAFLSSSFRRKPESSSLFLTSFPRKRESMLTLSSRLSLEVQSFVSPCGRAGYFLA